MKRSLYSIIFLALLMVFSSSIAAFANESSLVTQPAKREHKMLLVSYHDGDGLKGIADELRREFSKAPELFTAETLSSIIKNANLRSRELRVSFYIDGVKVFSRNDGTEPAKPGQELRSDDTVSFSGATTTTTSSGVGDLGLMIADWRITANGSRNLATNQCAVENASTSLISGPPFGTAATPDPSTFGYPNFRVWFRLPGVSFVPDQYFRAVYVGGGGSGVALY